MLGTLSSKSRLLLWWSLLCLDPNPPLQVRFRLIEEVDSGSLPVNVPLFYLSLMSGHQKKITSRVPAHMGRDRQGSDHTCLLFQNGGSQVSWSDHRGSGHLTAASSTDLCCRWSRLQERTGSETGLTAGGTVPQGSTGGSCGWFWFCSPCAHLLLCTFPVLKL